MFVRMVLVDFVRWPGRKDQPFTTTVHEALSLLAKPNPPASPAAINEPRLAHQGTFVKNNMFGIFRSMENIAWDGPKWGQEDFFPTNPDLVDILGRMDLDFGGFAFF